MTDNQKLGLALFRDRINRLDAQLMDTLGQRLAVCEEVAHYKRAHGIPMMQPERVEEVKERCSALGAEKGLRPEFVRELYGQIIGEACILEDKIIDREDAS